MSRWALWDNCKYFWLGNLPSYFTTWLGDKSGAREKLDARGLYFRRKHVFIFFCYSLKNRWMRYTTPIYFPRVSWNYLVERWWAARIGRVDLCQRVRMVSLRGQRQGRQREWEWSLWSWLGVGGVGWSACRSRLCRGRHPASNFNSTSTSPCLLQMFLSKLGCACQNSARFNTKHDKLKPES